MPLSSKPGLWKILLAVGILFALIAFVLGWIGFGVPDWHEFQYTNDTSTQYYGLWAYCQERNVFLNSVCRRWPTAAEQLYNGSTPNFIKTSQGLITTGMILLSLGLIAGVISAILPLLAYLAAALCLLAFIFLVIGLPIFGRQSNKLSDLQGDLRHSKRYGFWLMVPTIIFAFIAAILFGIAAFFYQKFGFGNIATHSKSRGPSGGQRLLGPANVLPGMACGANPMYGMPSYVPPVQPSLLSQYIAQRMPQVYAPVAVRQVTVTALPQPSVIPIGSGPAYVKPAYYRAPILSRPVYSNPINLSGQTVVAPTIRYA